MSGKTYLFIGGPADGRRIELDPAIHTYSVSTMAALFSWAQTDECYGHPGNVYYRRRLGTAKFFEYFVFSEMSGEEAIEALIRRYPQPLSP